MRKKTRLTITLSREVLNSVDSIVDRKEIRNRSHAIEHLLQKSLSPKLNQAVIVAGGKTNSHVHPFFLEFGRRSLLSITLDLLKSYGIRNILIAASNLNDEVRARFGEGQDTGLRIRYLSEDRELGTAGIIAKAKQYLDTGSFLVIHGDVLTAIDIEDFFKFHEAEGAFASMVVKLRRAEKKYGKVIIAGNKITSFLGAKDDHGLAIVNAGIYIFEQAIFDSIPSKPPAYLETDVFPLLAQKGELAAYVYQGLCYDVSRNDGYRKAVREWMKTKH